MIIFDSVQAILRKEVNPYLKNDAFTKLKNKMKSLREPFGVFHSENGSTTIIGSLKAILLCEQYLILYLKDPKTSMKTDVMNGGPHELKTRHKLPAYLVQRTMQLEAESEINNFSSNMIDISDSKTFGFKEGKPLNVSISHRQNNSQSYKSDTNGSRIPINEGKQVSVLDPSLMSSYQENVLAHSAANMVVQVEDSFNLSPVKDLRDCFAAIKQRHKKNSNKNLEISLNKMTDKTMETFGCKICGFEARLRREYKKHIESLHPITYSCSQCEYKTSKKVHYLRHVRNVHDNKRPFACRMCGLAFKRSDALKQHQVVHARNSKTTTRFECEVCSKVVRSAAYLREHMLTHSDERTFLCEICGASFKTRPVHRNHMKVVHSQTLQASCKYCDKTFATKYSLARHARQHSNRKSENWNTSGIEAALPPADSETLKQVNKEKGVVSVVSCASSTKTLDTLCPNLSPDHFITIDNQIPFVIHSTQEVRSDGT